MTLKLSAYAIKKKTSEPFGISQSICTRTLRNLVRNLVLKLHRIAPELIWAKDPIAKFCCWGNNTLLSGYLT